MAFRFVNLSSQKMPEVPVSSPLRKSTVVIKEAKNPSKLTIPSDFLFVGLLRVHRVAGTKLTCIRQEAVFLSRNILGLYVPSDREVYDYAGVHLQRPSSKSSTEAPKEMPIVVQFHSFDEKYVRAAHLDNVKNLMSLAQSQLRPTGAGFFYLSNLRLSDLLALPDQFVGFIDVKGIKWPLFVDYGFLCLKLGQLESLITTVPVWIDSQYRVRLGKFSVDSKSQPVLHFTAMPILLPAAFEYTSTVAEASVQPGNDTNSTSTAPSTVSTLFRQETATWHDVAGVSFVPRASNSLSCYGQIPHNFPVMEARPSITLDSWLPAFVRQIVKDAKKCQRIVVQSMHAAAVNSREALKKKSNQGPK